MCAKRERPTLELTLNRLRFRLAPLHPLPEGDPHPQFPATLLQYHLLTEAQLDSFAIYYQQTPLNVFTYSYPACMNWDAEFMEHMGQLHGPEQRVGMKRRKFGKFIGLTGCETPVEEVMAKEKWERKKERMEMKAGRGGCYLWMKPEL